MKPRAEWLYLSELAKQAEIALASFEAIDRIDLATAGAIGVIAQVQAFIAHAAAASRVLWPPRGLTPEQTERSNRRARHLHTVLGVDNAHPIASRRLRNHFEHFDERLDDWAEYSLDGILFDGNVGPLPRSRFADKALRHYEPRSRVFLFRGEQFALDPLAEGLRDLHARASRRIAELLATM